MWEWLFKCNQAILIQDVRDAIAHMVKKPRFICKGGTFDTLKSVIETDITVSECECTANIRETPFLIHPRDDCYVIEIDKKYNNDNLLCDGALCSNKEFVIVWAMAYVILNFLKDSCSKKEYDELMYERDCSMTFARIYLGVDDKLVA